MGLKNDGMIRSSMPWAHASKIDPKKYAQNRKHASEGLHYRGWTLVECGHYRYAVSDENANVRVRVCRARTGEQGSNRGVPERRGRDGGWIVDSAQLAKAVEKASHGSGMFELWDAFVTSFAAFLAAGSGNECDWLIERASGSMARLTKGAQEDVPKLYDPVIQAFEANPWQDLLGDVYMRLGIGNKNVGQFFTPYHVADMMAQLGTDEDSITKQIAEHGYITLNEPAAGGGANLIGMAHVLKDVGVNYQRHLWFVAQELSELTALTCYVQCSILGMAGVVMIGDTLKMDFHHSLYTPMCILEDCWHWRTVAKLLTRV